MRTSLAGFGAAALVVLTGTVQAQSSTRTVAAATLTVGAKANIFGSGTSATPAPAGGGGGTSPVVYDLPAGASQVTFQDGAGSVTCCSALSSPPYSGPGGAPGSTDVDPVGSISGVAVSNLQMFLVGVFLGPDVPSGSPPPTDTATKSPMLRQVFYVGAGPRTVAVPAGATRLYLGFADAFDFQGLAGYYDDNKGSVSIEVSAATRSSATPPSSPARRYTWSVAHARGEIWTAKGETPYVHLQSIRGRGTVGAVGSRVTAAKGAVHFFVLLTASKFVKNGVGRSFRVKVLAKGAKLHVDESVAVLTMPVTVLPTALADADLECLADPDGTLILRDGGPGGEDSLTIVGLCDIPRGNIWDNITVRIKPI